MYCLQVVPAWYKVVFGGIWRYMAVDSCSGNCIWWYMEVQGSMRIDQIVRAGTYWNEQVLKVQSGYVALLDSLLPSRFCLAKIAVLKSSAKNHTNANPSRFQSTLGPAPDSPFWRGLLTALVFRGEHLSENRCLVLNCVIVWGSKRSLDEICQVFGWDKVKSMFVWQCRNHLLRELWIFHMTTSPCVLLIDCFNLIVFQPTRYSPEDPLKIDWEEGIYHATIDL
jgi:hypothetical protein